MRQSHLWRQPELRLFRGPFPYRRGPADQSPVGNAIPFVPVRLDAEALFDYPFCVMSGNEDFTLPEKAAQQLQISYRAAFCLASPGCSTYRNGTRAFRREMKICFPQYSLQKIPDDASCFFRQSTPSRASPTSTTDGRAGGPGNQRPARALAYSKDWFERCRARQRAVAGARWQHESR